MRTTAATFHLSLPQRVDRFAGISIRKRHAPARSHTLEAWLRGWLHRRRTQWKQIVAATMVTAGTVMFWLFLVEEVLE